MCGVVAIFLNRPLNDSDVALGRALRAGLQHRGPDGMGEWSDVAAGVWLGHTRLAIQDLTDAAMQPMAVNDAAPVLSYNGEIYNFTQLREQFRQQGEVFHSTGDTEVLLRGWQRYGASILDRLDGMFSLALWDGTSAWLSIDAFGEKSLYVAQTPDGIYACSELSVLSRLLNAKATLDQEQLCAFMALGYLPHPHTGREGITRLPPGGLLRIEKGAVREVRRYWSFPELNHRDRTVYPLSDIEISKLRDSLCVSLEGRLQSDVPVCLFLSGGIDSSLVGSLAVKELGHKLESISVRFSDSADDECLVAQRIAQHLGLPHRIVDNGSTDSTPDAAWMLDLFGQPNDNLTAASVYQMSRTVRDEGFRVGLTGMGGDELFLGYQKTSFLWKHRHQFDIGEAFRQPMAAALNLLAGLWPRARTAAALMAEPDWQQYLTIKNLPCNAVLRHLPGYDDWSQQTFHKSGPAWLNAARADATAGMPFSQLTATDLASMRASLELRTPFLSRHVLDQVATIDPRRLVAYGQKSTLRRLLRRYLPDDITRLPKRGFILPQRRFHAGSPDNPPSIPSFPKDIVKQIWQRRYEPGYDRISVRLALAAQFMNAQQA
ncbi:MAG: asparagine synthase (glutamine-hydrolyzing) [Ferrovibrio sp.]